MTPRNRPKGFVPFGLGILGFFATPSIIGSQDLTALVARQSAAAERPLARGARAGRIATYSLPQPVGTAIPVSFSDALAGIENADIAGSIRERRPGEAVATPEQVTLPVIDRRLKGDRLAPPGPPPRPPEVSAAVRSRWPKLVRRPQAGARIAARAPATFRLASVDPAAAAKTPARAPVPAAPDIAEEADNGVVATRELTEGLAIGLGFSREEADPRVLTARLYFGGEPMSETLENVHPWQVGEAPKVDTLVAALDPEIHVAALPLRRVVAEPEARVTRLPPPRAVAEPKVQVAALPPPVAAEPAPVQPKSRPGETVAPKGEVTGEGQHPMTPAQRLGLDETSRARQQRCLANAIYFESRGEPVNGQIGVAQVVLNRAFSGYYPDTVCGVVYQNAHRYLRCQFTFACDRHADVVRDQAAWTRANAIAAGALDGRLWLPEVGKATHYHATYVSPRWVRSMHRLSRIGIHVFYRPRQWGDGADAPSWGDAAATAAAIRTL